jgi:hypothetical protein
MAPQEQVKQYLAYWQQLGTRLILSNGQAVAPQLVVSGNHYSAEFEAGWQQVLAVEGKNCYLEGTAQTISDLLSDRWELVGCARCSMPVPMIQAGIQSNSCPCFDLPTWPNTELPPPRLPVDNHQQLDQIRARLLQQGKTELESSEQG